jgi:hypothetical protein
MVVNSESKASGYFLTRNKLNYIRVVQELGILYQLFGA